MRSISGRTLDEWRALARRDDCFDQMVPSDLRLLISAIPAIESDDKRALLLRCHAELCTEVGISIALESKFRGDTLIAVTAPEFVVREIERVVSLIRDIETAVGGIAEDDSPQWLRDVIEGRIKMWESEGAD